MSGITLSDQLLAAILAAQLGQLGFEARLLYRTSSMQSKVNAMWRAYTGTDN